MIIAIDFDGVIVENNFPSTDFVGIEAVIIHMLYLQQFGHKFILWTCREGHHLHDALDWLGENWSVLDFVSVNQEPQELSNETRKFWKKEYRCAFFSRKINADYYIDDKSPGSIEWFLNWNGENAKKF